MQEQEEEFGVQQFVKELDLEDIRSILYADRLEAINQDESVGIYNISVKEHIFDSRETLRIFISGEFNCSGIYQNFSVETYVTLSLETLFQKYQEKIKIKNNLPSFLSVLLTRSGGKYSVQTTETSEQSTTGKTEEITTDDIYFSTGAKVILMRMLAQKNVTASFDVGFISKYGKLTKCGYKPMSNTYMWANNEDNLLVGYQEVIHQDPSVVTQYMMAKDGHLINMQQVGFGFTLKAVKFPGLLSLRQPRDKFTPEIDNMDWKTDLEMCSKYLDFKERKRNDYQLYLENNQQLKRLMSDLIQSILLRKPENIPQFLVEYFKLH